MANTVTFAHKWVIALFPREIGKNGKSPIELLPGTWITRKSTKGSWYSKFPPEKDFDLVPQWTKELKDPMSTWKSHQVKILGYADDWEKAEKRWQRALNEDKIMTTDVEGAKAPVKPVILSSAKAKELLNKRTVVRGNSLMKNHPSSKENVHPKPPSVHMGAVKKTGLSGKGPNTSVLLARRQTDKTRSAKNHVVSSSSDSSPERAEMRRSTVQPRISSIVSDSDIEDDISTNVVNSSTSPVSNGTPYVAPSTNVLAEETPPRHPGSSFEDREDHLDVSRRHSRESGGTSRTQSPQEHTNKPQWVSYFDAKFGELQTFIDKRITSAKRSILYDLKAKHEDLLQKISSASGRTIPEGTRADKLETLAVTLPIKTLEGFLQFEAELSTNEVKKKALKELLFLMCLDCGNVDVSIKKVLPFIIGVSVQGEYSGQGRKRNNVGKLNFSLTTVYSCFKDTVVELFRNDPNLSNFSKDVSRWFSGVKARTDKPDLQLVNV